MPPASPHGTRRSPSWRSPGSRSGFSDGDDMADVIAARPHHSDRSKAKQALMLGALGVVFGDIGTSPLYTMKQCLESLGGVTPAAVYGVLSLIAWSLISVVTFKYVLVMMRADNRGEGGILALTALALRADPPRKRYRLALVAGLLGAALFYGDGVITPA